MLILDNLLFSPLLWVFREINEAVQQEKAGEAEAVTRQLSELYMKLDTGVITEEEFVAAETQLLDRLDAIREENDRLAGNDGSCGEYDEEDEDEDEDEDDEEEEEEEEEEDDEEEDEDDEEEEGKEKHEKEKQGAQVENGPTACR